MSRTPKQSPAVARTFRRPLILTALVCSSLLTGLFWHAWPGAWATGGCVSSPGKSEGVGVQAAERGTLFLNRREGVELPTDDRGIAGLDVSEKESAGDERCALAVAA